MGTGSLSPAFRCSSPKQYCPAGSAAPLNTSTGYYALSASAVVGAYYNQSLCGVGSVCLDGVSLPCPAGYYGNETGVVEPLCSGPCVQGYYCPPGSTTPTAVPCGSAGVYCPAVSRSPLSDCRNRENVAVMTSTTR